MPGVDYYADLLRDRRRIDAFLAAIAAVVRPGDHVLDVGSGLGTFARAAARAGARRVTAIEADPTAAALARELGLERDFDGRIRLIEADVERAAPDEPADVVLFEDFARFAWHPHLRRILETMRSRLARPGARFLPEQVDLFAAPTDKPLPSVEADPALPFRPEALALLRRRHLSLPRPEGVVASELVGPGVQVGELRPADLQPPRMIYSGSVRAARGASVTGLAVWMRLRLAGSVALDNDPSLEPTAWKQMILPFGIPLVVRAGEPAEMTVEVAHGPGPLSELWRWRLEGPAGCVEGTTANALPGDAEYLKRGSPEYAPRPSPWHEVVREACRLAESRTPVASIADALYNSHSAMFATPAAAVDWVLDFLSRFRGLTS